MSHADLIKESRDVADGLQGHGNTIGASYMRHLVDALAEEMQMVARLRGALRVNALRAGSTHDEVDLVIAECRRRAKEGAKAQPPVAEVAPQREPNSAPIRQRAWGRPGSRRHKTAG